MISFRIREAAAVEWTQVSFDGEGEGEAAHLLVWMLAREGWTVLVAKESREWETLDESSWEDEV